MKNFDDARRLRAKRPVEDRTFMLGGQEFVVRARVRPEVLTPMDTIQDAVRGPNGEVVQRGTPIGQDIAVMDDVLVSLIEDTDDAHARYRALRADEDDPIEIEDIRDVLMWAIGLVTGRDGEDGRDPTGSASGSTPSAARTATRSMDGSSSPGTLTGSRA